MASKGPTDAQRVALWRAYDLICPYCGKPIDSYFQLEIDHIIPQSLLDDPQRLKELLIRLGIPDLDLNSYRNWLPVHGRPCNRDKSSEVQPDTTLLNYLGVARRHYDRAKKEEERFLRDAKAGVLVASIKHFIEAGVIKPEDLIRHLSEAATTVEGTRIVIRTTAAFNSQLGSLYDSSLKDADVLANAIRNLVAVRPSPHDQAVRRAESGSTTYRLKAGNLRLIYSRSAGEITLLGVESESEAKSTIEVSEEITREAEYLYTAANNFSTYAIDLRKEGTAPFQSIPEDLQDQARGLTKQLERRQRAVSKLAELYESHFGETETSQQIKRLAMDIAGESGGLYAVVDMATGELPGHNQSVADVSEDFMRMSKNVKRLGVRLTNIATQMMR